MNSISAVYAVYLYITSVDCTARLNMRCIKQIRCCEQYTCKCVKKETTVMTRNEAVIAQCDGRKYFLYLSLNSGSGAATERRHSMG